MKYRLWEKEPAERFCDAHYFGNGHLGLTVMGGVPKEEIVINEDTLWSGSENFYLNQRHYESFQKARELSLRGDVKAANDIINNEMEGRWFEAYMPLASLHLMNGQPDNHRNMALKKVIEPNPGDITGYSRSLDLDTAVETIIWERDGNHYEREYFVSHPANAAFVYCTASEKKLCMSFGLDSRLNYEYDTMGKEAYLAGIAPDHAEPSYTPITPNLVYKKETDSAALRFACCARVIACDGQVDSDGARVYVRNAGYALIALVAKTNFEGVDVPRKKEREKLLTILKTQLDELEKRLAGEKDNKWYEILKMEHLSDYQKLYHRVSIDLGNGLTDHLPTSQRLRYCREGVDDPSLAALILQYTRYLTIAGSRPGSQPMNLQGIWNDLTAPPWSSNYTNNINVEMNYWPCEVLGLPECHLPLMDMLEELAVSGKRTAREYYHMNGWVTHHNTDLWRSTEPACEDASWSWWPFGGVWLCEHIWTHYEYTQDEAFLRRMYPVLRGAAEFMLDFLTEDKNGYMVTAPSISPENKFICAGENNTLKELIDEISQGSRCSSNHPNICAVTVASTMDMSLLRELFDNVIHAAQILKIQDEIPKQAEMVMKRFPPYRTGRFGQLLEWEKDYEECTPGMGHISQLYPVYPANLFTEEKNKELFAAARRSLERRNLHAERQAGWPGAWRICLMARFKNSLECGHLIKSAGGSLGAGMLSGSAQQIDVTFGMGAGIAEMLLQSHQHYIEILPAITVDWAEGSFTGLRARGGFEISAIWKGGRLLEGTVRSLDGNPCNIKAVGLNTIYTQAGIKTCDAKNGKAEFETSKGELYFLKFDENPIADRVYPYKESSLY